MVFAIRNVLGTTGFPRDFRPCSAVLRLNVVEATEVQPQSVSNAPEPQGMEIMRI